MRKLKRGEIGMRIYVTVLMLVATGLIAGAASGAARRVSLSELAADPGRYMGHELEIARGYCVQGGVSGNEQGYQCSTDGNIWIDARSLAPASARRKIDANCGGIDAIERNRPCGARIRFTPSSMQKANTTIEAPKTILLLRAPEVYLTF
jgi:hypothetical protein